MGMAARYSVVMPSPSHSLPLLALSLTLGCESAQVDLQCRGQACAPDDASVPTPKDVPAPLPNPPVVISAACEHPHSVSWQPSDLANTESLEQPCLTERLDGSGCVGERIEHTFNAQGLITRTERWVFDPTVLEPSYVPPTSAITTYAYDSQGRRIERTHDDLSDGVIDVTQGWVYDERGRVTAETRSDPWGTRRIERTFDTEDRVVSEQTFDVDQHHLRTRRWHRSGALSFESVEVNGVEQWYRDHSFDEADRPLREHLAWLVEGERKTETTIYEYGALGLATRTWTRRLATGTSVEERNEFTRWPDGTTRTDLFEQTVNADRVSRRTLVEFDAAGRELSTQRDRNVDGIYEAMRVYIYDAQGNRLSEHSRDGQRILQDMRYRFDGEGREVLRRDAVRGTIVVTRYEPRHVHVRTTTLDGRLLSSQSTVFDSEGHVLEVAGDTDGDSYVDERFENTWSEAGLLLASRADRDADGTWDYVTAQMYDRAGHRLYAMSDANNDGQPERAELRSYACLIPTR